MTCLSLYRLERADMTADPAGVVAGSAGRTACGSRVEGLQAAWRPCGVKWWVRPDDARSNGL
jgi:hypothetical protein